MRKGWTETTLGALVSLRTGKLDVNAGVENGDFPFFTCSRETYKIDVAAYSGKSVIVAGNGDLNVKYYDGEFNAYQRTYILQAINELELDPKFLFHFMDVYLETLRKDTQGSTIQYLKKAQFTEAPISLPPLTEQKRIVDVVSSVDAYIDALQQQLNHALRAKSALLEKELQKNFSGARKVTLGEVLEISRGGSPRPIQNYLTTEDDGINWIKIGDASSSTKYIYETQQKIKPEGLSKTKKVYPGDFLLSNSMSFGRPYIMRTEGCIHDGWLLLGDVSKHFDEDFLYNFLRSGFIQAQFASLAAGSGVRNLNIEVVSGIEIVLPLVSDQKKIAQFLNSFDEQELALELALEKAVVLRGAILTDLLSGNHEIPASYDSLLGAA